MLLQLLLDPGISALAAREIAAFASAPARAVKETASAVKEAARAEVIKGFPRSGARIAKAIRQRDYKNRSGSAASTVYSSLGRRGPDGAFIDYLATFTQNRTLSAADGGWLIIPTKGRARTLDAPSRALRAAGIFTSGRQRWNVHRDRAIEIIPSGKPGVLFLIRHHFKAGTFDLLAVLVRRVQVRKRVEFGGLAALADRLLAEKLIAGLDQIGGT